MRFTHALPLLLLLMLVVSGCAPSDRPHTAQDSAMQAAVATQQAQAAAQEDHQSAAAAAATAAALTALADEQAKQAEQAHADADLAEKQGRLDEAKEDYTAAAKLMVMARGNGQRAAEARGRAAAAAQTAADDDARVLANRTAEDSANRKAEDERIRTAKAEAEASRQAWAFWAAVTCTGLAMTAGIVIALAHLPTSYLVIPAGVAVVGWTLYAFALWAVWFALGAAVLLVGGIVVTAAYVIPRLIRDRLAVHQQPAADAPATHADFAHLPLAVRWLVGHFLTDTRCPPKPPQIPPHPQPESSTHEPVPDR